MRTCVCSCVCKGVLQSSGLGCRWFWHVVWEFVAKGHEASLKSRLTSPLERLACSVPKLRAFAVVSSCLERFLLARKKMAESPGPPSPSREVSFPVVVFGGGRGWLDTEQDAFFVICCFLESML